MSFVTAEIYYNLKGYGPQIWINSNPDKDYLVNLKVFHDGVYHTVESFSMNSLGWQAVGRCFNTSWKIEIFEYQDNMTFKVWEDTFIPYHKKTHIYLDPNESIATHEIWSDAILKYNHKFKAPVVIESIHAEKLSKIFFGIEFVKQIKDPRDCYVNYVISKHPISDRPSLIPDEYNKHEVYLDSFFYPKCSTQVSDFEFAEGILFGVDLNDPYYYTSFTQKVEKQILDLYIKE